MPYSREERACLQRGTKKKEGGRRKCRRLAARGQTVADSAETGQLTRCSHGPPVCVPITAPDFHQKKNTSNAQDAYYYQPPTGIDIITDQVLNHPKLACKVLQEGLQCRRSPPCTCLRTEEQR